MKYLNTYKLFENYSRWGSKEITNSEFDNLFSENCKNYSDENTKIFRGVRDIGDYVFIDPLKGEIRSSIEDINVHIDSIDYLPSWENYPKYSKCVIGITGESFYSTGYGSSNYEVIPYDNSKIVVCPEPTIWESFSDGGWGDYIYLVANFFYELGINDVNELKKIGNIMQHVSYPGEVSDITNFLNHLSSEYKIKNEDITGLDCFNYINDYLFNPDERGFELVKYIKGFKVKTYKQVWTDGPVLMRKIKN
jgi:hypothetical protein